MSLLNNTLLDLNDLNNINNNKSIKIDVPKLNVTNKSGVEKVTEYRTWSLKMERLLRSQNLFDFCIEEFDIICDKFITKPKTMLLDTSFKGKVDFKTEWIRKQKFKRFGEETKDEFHTRVLDRADEYLDEVIAKQREYELDVRKLKSQEDYAGLILTNCLEGDLALRYSVNYSEELVSTKELWSNIKKDFIDYDIVQQQNLGNDWTNICIKENERIKDFAQRIKNLAGQLYAVHVQKTNLEMCNKFLEGCKSRNDLKTPVMVCQGLL